MEINYDALYDIIIEMLTSGKKKTIENFFTLCADNITLSMLNLLMLYSQNPTAGTVCEAVAWKKLGKKVKENISDDKQIILVIPKVNVDDEDIEAEFAPVAVISEKDTIQGIKNKKNIKNVADVISSVAKCSLEEVAQFKKGAEYNKQENKFYVSDSLNDKNINQALTDAYIDYKVYKSEKEEGIFNLVSMMVKNIVFYYFGWENKTIKSIALTRRLLPESDENTEQWKKEMGDALYFLSEAKIIAFDVIQDLTNEMMSFDEIMIVNQLLNDISYKKDFASLIQECASKLDETDGCREICSILSGLEYKLQNSNIIDALYNQIKNDGYICTYPPFEY